MASSSFKQLCRGPGVEKYKVVVQTMPIGPGRFPAARHVDDEIEYLRSYLFYRGLALRDAPRVDVDEVGPLARESRIRADLDHWRHREAIGCSPAGGKYLQVDARGELERAADKVAGGSGGEEKAAL